MVDYIKERDYKKLLSSIILPLLLLFATTNIYWVANKFGIRLATDEYQALIEFVAQGGTLVQGFSAIAGLTLPAWVGTAVLAFGTLSA